MDIKKRRCLFTKYQFEIGVLTLPAHIVIFSTGLLFWQNPIGPIAAVTGFMGSLAALHSLFRGHKEIEF